MGKWYPPGNYFKSVEQKRNFVLLVKQLPKLVQLECKGMYIPPGMDKELQEYLEVTKRKVKLVGGEWEFFGR